MSSRVQVVSPDCLVSHAAGLMGKARISCLVVVDGRKPLGILTEKDLLGLLDRHKSEAYTVAEIMSPSVITAAADTDFRSAYALLRRHGIRHLVVADGSGELLGVATATDFRTHLSQEVFSKIDHLHAVLDPVVSQLTGDASLGQAVKHMVDANWDYVLVVEQGIPLGIITERDIPRLWSTDRDPEAVPLREIMTRPLHCIPVSTQVAEASASMARLRVRHLPVVDEAGHLLGVVSQNRMLEKLGLALFDEVWRDHVSLQAQKSELETRLGLILEATGLGVWDYDHQTDGLVWSPKFALACGKPEGWSPDGLQGWMDLVHPRDRSDVLEGFQSALAPDDPLYQGEFRMQSADGNWLWIHVRGRVLQRDEHGRPLRTAGSMVDISERKNAELLLEAQRRFLETLISRPDREALLRAALDFALGFPELDGGVAVRAGPEGECVPLAMAGFSEPLACWENQTLSLPTKDLPLGKLYCSGTPPQLSSAEPAMPWGEWDPGDLLKPLFSGREETQTLALLPLGVEGDGTWEGALLLACYHTPRIGAGTAAGLQSLCKLFDQAVLRLRSQEDAAHQHELVRREQQFSEELINALPGVFFMTDGTGRLRQWNRLISNLTALPPSELGSLQGAELFVEEDRPGLRRAMAEVFTQGSATVEARMDAPGGDRIPFLLTGRRTRIGGEEFMLALGVDITETKRVRRSLEDERLRLRSLLNTIPDLVWLKDPDGVYLFCNPSYERLLAAPEADIIGKTDYHFVPKDLGDFFRERDRAAVEAGTSVMNEEWLISATDGYSGLYETLKTPLLTEEGSLVGVLGIARDITERRQAEAALQISVQEYQDLVEQIPIGVYKLRMLRDGGRVLDFVSPRWCEMLGVDGPEVLADERIAFGRIHPADRESFLHANGAAKQALSKFVWEGRILKDGEVRWLHIESRPSVLKNGDILWNGIQYDVTDRRNAEETLRRAAGVFHSTQEGIVITDTDNLIVDVNPAFTQITGFSREEVLGQNPKILGSGIHGADFYTRMWKTVVETGSWRGEVCNRRKSGELYTEMLSIVMARDQQGQIKEFIGVFSDISRLKEHAAELDRIAHYDTLTGLPNRRLLADRLGQAIARARRSGKLLAVCYLDLDGFKPVNDRFGHDAGDQLLVSLTRHLQEVLREEDTLARLGGDEFVLLLNDLLRDQECGQLLDRVLAAVSRPLYLANNLINLSASIGVTLYPHDNADGDTLLRHADQAMYRAKESGRNRYHLFDPEYDRQVREQRLFLRQVSQGLRDGEFVLYYQPKVNLIHGDVVGVEALIRWRHPKDGLLEPRSFLPMLSGTDVDGQLGQWVIDAALSQLARWNSEGLGLGVSVNISAEHLLSPDFAQGLQAALRLYPAVGEGGLELEILESVAISDLEQASLALQAGLSLGVRFALDDFGTGYSSLTYFRRLPVDTLKVDGSFVRDMLDDPDDLGIVESVVRLAEAFNRQAIAEGVETLQHASLLVKLGCKLGQGYGIAPPMPAEAVGGWMKSWYATQAWRQLGSSCLPSEDTALLLAIVSHRQWGERVSNYVQAPNGGVPTMDSHACRLGQWYYRGGMRRYGQVPKFRELEGVHERFHALGNELSVLAGRGQSALAQSRLPEFFALRDALLRTVEQLIDHAQAD